VEYSFDFELKLKFFFVQKKEKMKENLDSLKDQERVTSLLTGRKVFGLMKRREFVDKTSTKALLKRRQKRL
jgi:hypothetical protein